MHTHIHTYAFRQSDRQSDRQTGRQGYKCPASHYNNATSLLERCTFIACAQLRVVWLVGDCMDVLLNNMMMEHMRENTVVANALVGRRGDRRYFFILQLPQRQQLNIFRLSFCINICAGAQVYVSEGMCLLACVCASLCVRVRQASRRTDERVGWAVAAGGYIKRISC